LPVQPFPLGNIRLVPKIVSLFLVHCFWLQIVPFIQSRNRTHCGCDRSAGDTYSSLAPHLWYIQLSVFAHCESISYRIYEIDEPWLVIVLTFLLLS
jgi:hypothetical protein